MEKCYGYSGVKHEIGEALPLIASDKGRKLRILKKMYQDVNELTLQGNL